MKSAAFISSLAAVFCSGFVLAACSEWSDDPAIKVCEAITKKQLKAPSTYKRIKASLFGSEAIIEYDAENSFGVPLREYATCRFRFYDGGFRYVVEDQSGETDDERLIRELSLETAASEANNWSSYIGSGATKLEASSEDRKADACVQAVVTKLRRSRPPLDAIVIEMAVDGTVQIKPSNRSSSDFSVEASCKFDEQAVKSVTVGPTKVKAPKKL